MAFFFFFFVNHLFSDEINGSSMQGEFQLTPQCKCNLIGLQNLFKSPIASHFEVSGSKGELICQKCLTWKSLLNANLRMIN